VMIHPIGQTPVGTQIGRAYLLSPSGSPTEFREYLVNRTAWADGYLSDQPAGYIFADSAIADYTYLAIERLLRIKFEVRLPPSAFDASKRFEGTIQDLKRRLNDAGYYRGVPFDIRPTPERLNMADVVRTIAEFAPKLERYQKPELTNESQTVARPTALCREWLRQLESDAHVECGLQVLAGFRMIDRQDTVAALRNFIETHDDFRGGVVVPFGSARDSSAIQTYFSGDLQGTHISTCMSLSEATRQSNGKPIIFVDDFVGSGGQSRDILAAGFGRDELRSDLGENRDLFDGDIQEFLKQAKVAFVFTAAWDSGIAEITAISAKLGLNARVYRLLGEDQIPFATTTFFDNLPEHQVQAFLKRCSEIGHSLIESKATAKREETDEQLQQRVASRALGYGNRAMLLASPFNVPTQTMTMFWADGIVDGAPWCPLMPRRKKV
jgi:deoxynucleoside triphosphate triphosphohydrolase SAMHD1